MLPEIAVEALHFLSRRDLDKACAVSKRLHAMIAKCFDVYQRRPVPSPEVWIEDDEFTDPERSLNDMDEAVRFVGSVLRHSYVELLQLGANVANWTVSPIQWTTLIDSIRSGAVRDLYFHGVDFSALDTDAFAVLIGSPALQSLVVRESVVHVGFVTDDLLRSCANNGVADLHVLESEGDTPHSLSDEAVMVFVFRPNAVPERRSINLALLCSGLTDTFVAKFFERLRAGVLQPIGILELDVPVQRGLSAYTHYLAPGVTPSSEVTYRFPSIRDRETSYYDVELELIVEGNSSYMHMQLRPT